MERLNKNSDL